MGSLVKLYRFVRPYWALATIGPLLMLLEVVMDLLQPRLMQRIVDVGIAQLDMAVVVQTGLLMIGVAFIGALGGSGNTLFSVRVSQAVGADLRSALFAKVQSFSFGNLDKLETGNLITRLTNDVTQIQEVILILLRIMIRVPLMLVGSLVMAVLTAPRLALLLLILGPVVIALTLVVISKAHPLFLQVQQRLDAINTVMQENLAGVRVVKAFVRAHHEEARFRTANERLMDTTIDAARLMAVVMPFMMLTLNFGIVAVLWFGGRQVVQGSMKIGQLMAFINYLLTVLRELLMVGMLLTRVSRAQASADRIVEVLESEPEIVDRPDALKRPLKRGHIAFESVTFGYDGATNLPVLRNVTFEAEPGQMVAILGATGSGKSSLIHLLPRFYDVRQGRVLLDGIDVRDIAQDALHHSISIALQEPILFSGTIRDNIRYGRPDATEEEIIAAAKAAQAHDFICEFPEGYDTLVGQRGVNLSGGQKQRLAIARALLVKPTVLILDDSTSSVDVETEAKIQEALVKEMAGRTSLIVAQRVSTVLNADKILVLDDGEIAAEGTHEELLTTSPIYREIYESQLGDGVSMYG